MERRGKESHSQLQGGQEAEAEAEARPSIKCQYRGGPTMYAARQIAINPRTAFKTPVLTAISPSLSLSLSQSLSAEVHARRNLSALVRDEIPVWKEEESECESKFFVNRIQLGRDYHFNPYSFFVFRWFTHKVHEIAVHPWNFFI